MPLERDKKQIRLLKIERSVEGFWNTPCCTLETVDLLSATPYIALSYEWGGSDAAPKKARINGQILTIKVNLYNFFCYFRASSANGENTYLWIDQVSIDQFSVEERNHQIGLMSEIYSKAWLVIAWLGCTDEAQQAAEKISKHSASIWTVLTLLTNTYFDRLWIIQELLLAQQLYLLCGNIWFRPHAMMEHLPNYNDSIAQEAQQTGYPSTFLIWDSIHGKNQRTLAHCLKHYSRNKCTNPRDKVYGLLGIVLENERPPVDYSKSVWDVYVDAVYALARNSHPSPEEFFSPHRSTLEQIHSRDARRNLAVSMGFVYDDVYSKLKQEVEYRWHAEDAEDDGNIEV
jgi:hypothetical protein